MREITRQKKSALQIIKRLKESGFTAYFAGGCVRDEILGREPKDYDVATDALPDEVEAMFPKTLALGKAFGVIAVVDGKEITEVATFRKESGTLDGRRPETVIFCAAEEDAKRRDFTINGMFYDPVAEKLLDFVGGQEDLQKKTVRAIGNPSERFQEDHLRLLRAVRFAHTLGFDIEPETESAIREMAGLITKISIERIEQEFSRLLTESPKPGDGLKQIAELGLLRHIIPEMIPMIGQEQPPQFHPEGDVFEHTVLMLNLMNDGKTASRELAYTVLLHDVGKPPTATIGPGTDGQPRIRFDGHAVVGAEMAGIILRRLKLPKKEIQHIVEAIRSHMRFIDVQKMRISKLRKMIGAETFDLEMELHRLDCLGSHEMLDNYDFLNDYMEEMASEPILPVPWLRGHDLIAMGFTEGRVIGKILKEAYDAQMEDRFENREQLLEWVNASHQSEERSDTTAKA